MARIVVLGIPGEDGLWAANLDTGTVTPLAVPASGNLKTADDLRKAGATITAGVNLAALAVTDGAGGISGGFYDTSISGGFYDK